MKKDPTKTIKRSNYKILTDSLEMRKMKSLGKFQVKKEAARLEKVEAAKKIEQIESPASLNETISTKSESELKPIDYENMKPVFPSMYSWPEESVDSLAKQFAAFKKKRKYF